MSTKTNFKRVALVAVAALGLGVLTSVAPANADALAGSGVLHVAGDSNTGAAVVASDDSIKSTGIVYWSGTTGDQIGGASQLTQTVTMISAGTLVVAADPTGASGSANDEGVFIIDGGTISASTGCTVVAGAVRAYSAGAGAPCGIGVKPNSGVTSFTISYYESSTSNTATTLTAKVKATVVANGAAYGKVSAADSTVYWGTATSSTSDTSTTDVTSSNYQKANTQVIEGTIYLVDEFGNDATSSTGLITCSVTGGAVCNLTTSAGTIAAGSAASAFSTHTAAATYFSVAQGTENAPANGTLTVKYNDTVLATKSFVITGTVAKLVVSNSGIGRTGGTTADNFYYTAQDSAGNTVYMSSGIAAYSLSLNEAVTAASVTTYQTSSAVPTGKGSFTCSGTAGYGITVNGAAAKLKLRVLDASGTYVYSNEFDAKCGGDAKAFTASLDKASYSPGSVATLTIKFLDTKGNAANDEYTVTAGDTTGLLANIVTTVGAPGTVVTAPATADKPLAGVKTYQFIVGTTEGDFNMVVDAPYVRAQNLALAGAQAKITIAYSIKSTSTAVTNADVLKAIVSLIASINKQIAALQKALLKK